MRARALDRRFDQLLLLTQMDLTRAGRRAGAGIAANVVNVLAQQRPQPRLHERPAAHVLRLLLHPRPLLRLAVAANDLTYRLLVKRVELLDAHNRDALPVLVLRLRLRQVIVDFSAAEDHLLDASWLSDRIVEDFEEAAGGQLLQWRGRGLEAQHALGRQQHERLAKVALHLTTQNVEVLRRRRGIADLEVILGAQLQIAFEASAGVVRALPLVAVRQQHHQTAIAFPLRLARGNELVDDDLGAVGEVAKLGLPQHQRLWSVQRVAEFEAKDRRFRKQTIVDLERRLFRPQRVQWRERLAGARVVQDGVTLAERAAPRVLPAQPNRRPLQQQRTEGQQFGERPVDPLSLCYL